MDQKKLQRLVSLSEDLEQKPGQRILVASIIAGLYTRPCWMILYFLCLVEFDEDIDEDDVSRSSEVTNESPRPRSELPNSFDAPHVHINPPEYNQENIPGSPGESISAFPLATSPAPLEESASQTSNNQVPLEETAPGQSTPGHVYAGHAETVPSEAFPVHSSPGKSIPEQSIHVETIPSQTISEQSTSEHSTPVEYPSISATPLKGSKSGATIVAIPAVDTSSSPNKGGTVLIKLPLQDDHHHGNKKIKPKIVKGTVLKINGTLYLVKGTLTKLPHSKAAHANQIVGGLLADVISKHSHEHLVNDTEVGVTANGGDGEIVQLRWCCLHYSYWFAIWCSRH